MNSIKFKTHNDIKVPVGGTSLRGYIEADFKTLVNLFGHPSSLDGEPKIDWIFEICLDDSSMSGKRLEAGEVKCHDISFLGKIDGIDPIKFPPPQVITIYNWKNGPGYGFSLDPYKLNHWHVGGNYSDSVEIIQALIDAAKNGDDS